MNDDTKLTGWEKAALVLSMMGQILSIFLWYVGRDADLSVALPVLKVVFGVAGAVALDLVVVTTTMGRRGGRQSWWGALTILAAAVFSAAIALDAAGGPTLGAWNHISYPVVIVLFAQHLAAPKAIAKALPVQTLQDEVTKLRGVIARYQQRDAQRVSLNKQQSMNRKGFVYLMHVGGLYKIGWARDVTKRQADLQVGAAYPIELHCAIQCDNALRLEQQMQRCYRDADRHVRGEWFALTTEDIAAIENIGATVAVADIDDVVARLSMVATPLPREVVKVKAPAQLPSTAPRLLKQSEVDIVQLRDSGLSFGAIATQLGISRQAGQ